LPDLRGRTIIGVGQGNGLTNRPLGEISGAETHKLLECQIPSHNHTLYSKSHYHKISQARNHLTGNNDCCGRQGYTVYGIEYSVPTDLEGNHDHTMTAQGGNGSHNNMQQYIGLNYIIRVK
jgi:microcystin-dependent protein